MTHSGYLCLALLAVAAPAAAGEVTHTVAEGETLEAIAKSYYGAAWKAVYLATRNEVAPKELVVGKKLIIPGSWIYVVKRGDSLTTIAKKRLGAEARYTVLMRQNNLKSASDIDAGRELLMPFHLTHVVQNGDTLAGLAQRYYRNSKQAALIKEYNSLGDTLKSNQRLTIPVFDSNTVALKERHPTPLAAAAAKVPPAIVPPATPPAAAKEGTPVASIVVMPGADALVVEAQARLEASIQTYQAGEFEVGCPGLETLLKENRVAGNDRAALFKYLGFCAVAYGDLQGARDYFRTWIELAPKASLDPVQTSPKILAVFYDVMSEARAEPKKPDEDPTE